MNCFLALHGHFGGDPVYDRFSTNAFNVFNFAAICPETAVGFSKADRLSLLIVDSV